MIQCYCKPPSDSVDDKEHKAILEEVRHSAYAHSSSAELLRQVVRAISEYHSMLSGQDTTAVVLLIDGAKCCLDEVQIDGHRMRHLEQVMHTVSDCSFNVRLAKFVFPSQRLAKSAMNTRTCTRCIWLTLLACTCCLHILTTATTTFHFMLAQNTDIPLLTVMADLSVTDAIEVYCSTSVDPVPLPLPPLSLESAREFAFGCNWWNERDMDNRKSRTAIGLMGGHPASVAHFKGIRSSSNNMLDYCSQGALHSVIHFLVANDAARSGWRHDEYVPDLVEAVMRDSIAHREQYYRAEDRYCTWGMLEAWNLVALHSDPDARSESLVSPLWLYALLHRHQDGKANFAPHTDSIICEPLVVVMVKLFMAFRASQLVDVHRIGAKSDERQCSVPLGNLLSLHGTLQGPLASICVDVERPHLQEPADFPSITSAEDNARGIAETEQSPV